MGNCSQVREALAESYKILFDRGFESLRFLLAEDAPTPFVFYIYRKTREHPAETPQLCSTGCPWCPIMSAIRKVSTAGSIGI